MLRIRISQAVVRLIRSIQLGSFHGVLELDLGFSAVVAGFAAPAKPLDALLVGDFGDHGRLTRMCLWGMAVHVTTFCLFGESDALTTVQTDTGSLGKVFLCYLRIGAHG